MYTTLVSISSTLTYAINRYQDLVALSLSIKCTAQHLLILHMNVLYSILAQICAEQSEIQFTNSKREENKNRTKIEINLKWEADGKFCWKLLVQRWSYQKLISIIVSAKILPKIRIFQLKSMWIGRQNYFQIFFRNALPSYFIHFSLSIFFFQCEYSAAAIVSFYYINLLF